MEKFHIVEDLRFESGKLKLCVDGKPLQCDLQSLSPRLANATDEERSTYEISPGGYGIHWPMIDEDISIDGLLGVTHHPDQADRKRA